MVWSAFKSLRDKILRLRPGCPALLAVLNSAALPGKTDMAMDVAAIREKLAGKLGAAPGFGGSLRVDFGEAGSILIDGAGEAVTICDGAGKAADCTIALTLETYEQLASRQLSPMSAVFQGKLKVDGNMGMAMKLGPLLQQ